MRHLYLLLSLLCIATIGTAQTPMKSFVSKPHAAPKPIEIASDLPDISCEARTTDGLSLLKNNLVTRHPSVASMQISASGSLWFTMNENRMMANRASVNDLMTTILPRSTFIKDWSLEWRESSASKDENEVEHIRIQQYLAGHPVARQDMILNVRDQQVLQLNGFAWTGPTPEQLPDPKDEVSAMQAATDYLVSKNVKFATAKDFQGISQPASTARLVWLPKDGKLCLVYEVKMHPNLLDHWQLYINASTLEIIEATSQLCAIYPKALLDINAENTGSSSDIHTKCDHTASTTSAALLDGASVTTDQDLLGQNRTVNAYNIGANFFMIDASRNGMFNASQSVMPNDPVGVIWTIDGQNGSPQQSNFELAHVSNTNNNWAPLEVSAHFNAGESYEYFRQKFNRNSLNGSGGNIISIINITDENGNDLDNAFWSGTAMFYGNGDVAFQPLAKGLDVAGHEMSHGVIQNTANLEYIGQSGALNESYADVFGAMIDRNDWQVGEDVVKLSHFPSGALRDLSNPHNGGNSLGDRGWQPAHMNEFQVLPNTPEGDNGGVHVNSGIPNRAFFLFATSVGKDKAEQVYYKALRDYLVRSSQFIDMRNAVIQAATDLHGAASAEVTAAKNAFDAVGIGAGSGGNHQDDLETNEGADFIIATDLDESALYIVPPGNPSNFLQLDAPAPITRPSFTDDGSAAVYIDDENNMILLDLDWSGQNLNYGAFYLESNPQGIWRNVVVSKDGTKIAFTTTNLTNEIHVFDFTSQSSETFELYNPTTGQGIVTGDVLYADAMEWDYSGQFVMYDALNLIQSQFGDGIEYWDISFLNTWNNGSNDFALGQVSKLYNSLPENVSVGNPSFAKNSPYIITFDYVEEYFDIFGQFTTDYRILANNIETGVTNEIFFNTTIGYPSYSRLDDQILFTNDNGNLNLATIDVQPNDKTKPVPGSGVILVTNAQKGVWFQTGSRELTGINDIKGVEVNIYPQPAADAIQIQTDIREADYSITDITGRIVLTGTYTNNSSVQVASLPQGLYVIRLDAGDGTPAIGKFVKQ